MLKIGPFLDVWRESPPTAYEVPTVPLHSNQRRMGGRPVSSSVAEPPAELRTRRPPAQQHRTSVRLSPHRAAAPTPVGR